MLQRKCRIGFPLNSLSPDRLLWDWNDSSQSRIMVLRRSRNILGIEWAAPRVELHSQSGITFPEHFQGLLFQSVPCHNSPQTHILLPFWGLSFQSQITVSILFNSRVLFNRRETVPQSQSSLSGLKDFNGKSIPHLLCNFFTAAA